MNFGKFDMSLLVVMTIAIVSMAMVFPSLGLVENDPTADGDLPALEIDGDRFGFAGEFPDRPGTPDSGTLYYNINDTQRSNQQAEFQGGSTRAIVTMIDDPQQGPDVGFLNFEVFDSNNNRIANDNATFSAKGDYKTLSAGEWSIEIDITEFDDNESYEYESKYELTERDASDGGWLSSIPVIGTAADVGSALAGYVAWIGSVLWFFVSFTFEVFLNLIGVLFDVVTFASSLIGWLVTSYTAIIAGAEGIATLFVTIPGVILSLLFAKLGFIGVSLLPTT